MNENTLREMAIQAVKEACEKYWIDKNVSFFKSRLYNKDVPIVGLDCADDDGFYVIDSAEYSTEYKSYYVDRQNQLIGFGIIDFAQNKQRNRYILLHFDGYELVEIANVPLDGVPSNMRGAYIDGYMYMFGFNDYKIKRIY